MLVVKKNKTIIFSPFGTKLYFHVNSLRKIYIILTFNKAAFSRDCKPRITTYLIAGSIWPVTMPLQAYPWELQFFLFLVVYSPPLGMQKETIPHPRTPDQPYICVLGVHIRKLLKYMISIIYCNSAACRWRRKNLTPTETQTNIGHFC